MDICTLMDDSLSIKGDSFFVDISTPMDGSLFIKEDISLLKFVLRWMVDSSLREIVHY